MQIERGDDEYMPTYKIVKGERVRVLDLTKLEGKIVEVSHEEVQKAADAAQPKMTTIMRELINRA